MFEKNFAFLDSC